MRHLKRVLDSLELEYEDNTTPIPDEAQASTMRISSYSQTESSPPLFAIIGGTFKNVYRKGNMQFIDGVTKDWTWLIDDDDSIHKKAGWFNCPLWVAQKAYITASLKGIIIHESSDLESIGSFEFFPGFLKTYHDKLSLLMSTPT